MANTQWRKHQPWLKRHTCVCCSQRTGPLFPGPCGIPARCKSEDGDVTMGDKGGKKDKQKAKKQKTHKQELKDKKKRDKQPKSAS